MYFVYFSQKMLEKNLISEVSRYVDKPVEFYRLILIMRMILLKFLCYHLL